MLMMIDGYYSVAVAPLIVTMMMMMMMMMMMRGESEGADSR